MARRGAPRRRAVLLRAGARRYGVVLLAGVALAGTAAAARVPVPVGGPQQAASPAATAAAHTHATHRKLLRADVMVVAQKALPAKVVARVARLRGVQAARANDHCTSPEQSNVVGPEPPHTYG